MQEAITDNLHEHIDTTSAKLDNVNKRLKEQLDKVRSADKFCIDFILVIILKLNIDLI